MFKAKLFRHLVAENSRGLFISVNLYGLSQDNSLSRILKWDFPYIKTDFCHLNSEFLMLCVCVMI